MVWLDWMVELVKYEAVCQLHLKLLSFFALMVQTEKAHNFSEGGRNLRISPQPNLGYSGQNGFGWV